MGLGKGKKLGNNFTAKTAEVRAVRLKLIGRLLPIRVIP